MDALPQAAPPAPAAAPARTGAAARAPGADRATSVLFALLVGGCLLAFPPISVHRPWQDSFATYFVAITLTSVPYILIGSLFAGLIEWFLPAALLPRLSRRLGLWGIPAMALASPAFPACECGVLAVARGLLGKGLPLPHTITYLVAGPILNPTVLYTTWLAFQDWRYPVLRALGALAVGIPLGFAMRRLAAGQVLLPGALAGMPLVDARAGAGSAGSPDGPGSALPNGSARCGGAAPSPACGVPTVTGAAWSGGGPVAAGRDAATQCGHGHAHSPSQAQVCAGRTGDRPGGGSALGHIAQHVLDHFIEMAGFFLIGVAIASAMKTAIGATAFSGGSSSVLLAPLLMMAAAFVLSLCAEADAFIAASFVSFSMPAQLAFLVFGPMFDIKLLLMYRAVFRTRFIVALATGIALLVAAYAMLLTLAGVRR